MENKIQFTRINNDINGNPRYVCHYLNFIKPGEFDNLGTTHPDGSVTTASEVIYLLHRMSRAEYEYSEALKRAKQIGGKKYHNKQYDGGIVFQSYNIAETAQDILNLLK